MPLDDTLAGLPTSPGVYLMRDDTGQVIYVGKAINLRNRVRSYFQSSRGHSPKVQRMVERIADIDYLVTGSELEALILECNLIKKHRPHYNVRLRDDKTYPFIRVTVNEPYPRIFMTRTVVRDGSRYFGPYTDVPAVRETLRMLKTLFPLRQCSRKFDPETPARRPCLNFHIRRCLGPCAGQVEPRLYREMVDEVVLFLEGRQVDLIESLRRRMEAAADGLDFEQAARLRDQMRAVEKVVEKQRIVSDTGVDQDVIAFATDPWGACVRVMFVRDGKIVGSEHFMLGGADGADDAEMLSAFIKEYYSEDSVVPRELLLQAAIDDADILEKWLAGRRGGAVSIKTPQRGARRRLVELAAENAREYLARARAAEQSEMRTRMDGLAELAAYLKLDAPPARIECYDISNLQGTDAVGSMVVFEEGRPAKSQYRRYRIRRVEGQDDFAMMGEVIERRLARATGENPDPKFARLPDLIVIDGGKGQLNSAGAVVDAMAQSAGLPRIPVVSLAERNEEVFVRGESAPLILPRESKSLRLVQHMRDEAHRFAVAYHRSLRGKKGITSELAEVPGIGKKRLVALMRKFGSLGALAEASEDEIVSVKGMTAPAARAVWEHLHPEEER
ncbi:MAG: excinuclease ABC subunit UvrC [Bacillota bacterium]